MGPQTWSLVRRSLKTTFSPVDVDVVTPTGTFVLADAEQYEVQAASSPMKSPHRYSPSVFPQQVLHTLVPAQALLESEVAH